MAGNGQYVVPFVFGSAIGAMQQMQQQQYLLQQRQNKARQQAAAAWSRLGPAVLGCISQNYQIEGPQFGYTYGIFPEDYRYVGMVQGCMTAMAQEQQRQQAALEQQERKQEAERQQQLAEQERQQKNAEIETQAQNGKDALLNSNWLVRGLPSPSEPASAATLLKIHDSDKNGWRLHVIGSLEDNKYLKYTDAKIFPQSIIIYRENTVLGSKPYKYPFTGQRSGCLTSDFATAAPLNPGSDTIPDNISIDKIKDYASRSSFVMVENGVRGLCLCFR